MTATLEELVTPMTVAEAQESVYTALAVRGVQTTGWKPGGVVRTIIAALAIILAAFSQLQAALARSGFLDLARGAWLTLLARYVYGVERDLGTFASGTILATNAGGGVYSGTAGDLIVANGNGKTYRNTAAYSIAALATNVEIAVEAVEIGSASTSLAGDITTLVTTLNGVTVTNPTALVGTDEQTDASLRTLCRESLAALSPNGPSDAYSYFAKQATDADGVSIGVTRARVVPDGYGNVTVYVATATGGVTGTSGDPDTDLGAIQASIDANVEPIAITATVATAVPVTIAPTYEVWVASTIGMTEAQVTDAIASELATFASELPIGGEVLSIGDPGYVYVDAIRAAIVNALPVLSVAKLTLSLPAADTLLDADEAPVLGTVSATVNFVTRGAV